MFGTLSRDGGKIEDAVTVRWDSEDIVADGHTSSPRTTFEHALEPEGKAQAEVPAKDTAVDAIHATETAKS